MPTPRSRAFDRATDNGTKVSWPWAPAGRFNASMTINYARLIFVVLIQAAAHNVAVAEAGNPLTDTVSLGVGAFFLNTSTDLSVNGHGIEGSDIDAERDLGLGDKDSLRIDAYWRFAARHKIRLMYFDFDRSQAHVLSRDITFNGTTYSFNTQVDSRIDTTIAEVAYEYAFVRNGTWELAASIGIHDLDFKTRLATSGGQFVVANSQSASANGPLPVLGLDAVWRLTETLHIDAQAQFFKISISPYDGRLENYNASLVWQPIAYIGIGAGYDYFLTRVDVDGSHFDGSLKWRYGGARVFIHASF